MGQLLENRRHFTRVKFDAAVTLCQLEHVCHAQVIDISLNGLLVETPTAYALNTASTIDCVIYLCNSTQITMTLHLRHSSSTLLGFQIEHIDIDSMVHLRKLIEMNLNDANACDRIYEELLQPAQLPQ